jgi:hypothetical protein
VGNVVGQEWKNLVESSMTADQPAPDARGARDSPVQLSLTSGPGLKPAAGSADAADEEARANGAAAARWHNTDVKIDVLRELEDVASMTINETGFFCKYVALGEALRLRCVEFLLAAQESVAAK